MSLTIIFFKPLIVFFIGVCGIFLNSKNILIVIMSIELVLLSINFNYSFLVIAKSSMLNNEYKLIKETLFQDFEKIK